MILIENYKTKTSVAINEIEKLLILDKIYFNDKKFAENMKLLEQLKNNLGIKKRR